MRMSSIGARCVFLAVLVGGCLDARGPEPTRSERIDRTRVALEAVLVPEAAAREAIRYVDMCDASPDEMLYEQFDLAWDPDGPELFESLDDAVRGGDFLGGTGIPLAALACTRDGHDAVVDLQNI